MLRNMKKIFILSLMILMNVALYADFKIMAGVNLSKFSFSPGEGDTKWSFSRGFLGGIGLEKKLSYSTLLEFDILFFQKGSSVKFTDLSDLKMRYRINTISIPVLLRRKIFSGSSPYVVGGIELSAILSHKAKFEGEGEEAVDLKKSTKALDFGFVVGGGYEIELQEYLYFFIEARYHLGLRNIINNPFDGHSMKTRALLVIIGIRS